MELTNDSELNSFVLLNVSNYNAYFEMLAFSLLFLSRAVFFEI